MKKRMFACLMVAVMLFGILALPVAAEDTGNSGAVTQSEGGTTGGGTTGGGDTTGGGTTSGGDTTGGGSTGGGDTSGGGTTGGGDTTGGGTTGGGDTTGGGTTGGGETGGGTTGGGDTTGGGTTGGGDTTGGGSTGGGDTTGGGSGDGSGSGSTTCKHSWVHVTVPSSCTETGATGYVCVYCNAVTGEQELPLAPHTYDNNCDPTCNVCAAERQIEHKFSKQWSKNSKNHWHACTVCGEKSEIGNHFAGPAATEDKDQICLTCGIILTRKLEHKHEWAKDWSSDETGHYHKCTDEDCTEVEKVEKHVYDDSCDSDCNVCGYVTETAHSYDGEWHTDENSHWSVCTVCGHTSEAAEHVSVSEATDTQAELCAVCGYEMAPSLVHTHSFGESWSYDDNLHWYACECGEKLEEAPHTFDEATEQKDGTLVSSCTVCGAQRITEAAAKASGGAGIGLIILLVVLVIALIGCVVALIVVIRMQKKSTNTGKFGR